jgi:hypothetical protein
VFILCKELMKLMHYEEVKSVKEYDSTVSINTARSGNTKVISNFSSLFGCTAQFKPLPPV